ncbi:hypothetical protein [Methylicorpusculum sp.]|uniref:hypothetical protein n=1 Tax=Methylicorpusculum sp. TaxID=2713644 RepID=UPI00272F6B4D|nr:hypothetical protein [Methylicorpusculum sp.]MDP2180570.1 hypothetical protein [Methylicorpusculum sp.]MDP3527730.1 hypothetical protein [Methylicorpusculum sp.]
MQAEKLLLETDEEGRLKTPLILPPNAKLEAIFLILNQDSGNQRRVPSAKIAGKGNITGDIISPVIEPDDWGALS